VLGQIAARYDQERTEGSDIRDSKNNLDNIKTSLADKLVPLTQAMREPIRKVDVAIAAAVMAGRHAII
jgi:hypothetical protein